MNVIKFFLYAFVLMGSVIFGACNEPSIIGSNLLDEEFINVRFVDSSTLVMKTVQSDSVQTFSNSNLRATFMLGDIQDPVFGYSNASFYSELNIGLNNTVNLGTIANSELDSAVLVLAYDDRGFYGNENRGHTVKVYEVIEDMDVQDTLYSNVEFELNPMPIGEIQVLPSLDSISLTPHGQPDTIVQLIPQLRIPISGLFVKDLRDTMVIQNDTTFRERYKGLHITSESGGESMFGINLTPAAGDLELNRLIVYITEDTIAHSIQYDLRGVRTGHFDHDYSGSIVEPFIDSESMGDSLIFVQGMSGTDIELDIPFIRDFDGYLINKVELELFSAELMEDDTTRFPPVSNLIMSRKNDDGENVFVEDLALALNRFGLEFLFGGNITEDFLDGVMVRKYNMNITTEVISIIADDSRSTKFKISPFVKEERPNRSVIFGPRHSTYPARLKITFTEP